MSDRKPYAPGPAHGARIGGNREGEQWTLILIRELRHSPAMVWQAITDPTQLAQWAPFDANRSLTSVGPVTLTTVGTPTPQVSETAVTRADEPRLLEYDWGGNGIRWELEPLDGGGTRLTLWHNIDRRFISWGAAGWHICFDVLDRLLAGDPLGRMAGPVLMKFDFWQPLTAEYAKHFEIERN